MNVIYDLGFVQYASPKISKIILLKGSKVITPGVVVRKSIKCFHDMRLI